MSELIITPEQAKEYITRQHDEGLELPRCYNFTRTSNHLEASIVWIAMSGIPANLRQVYAAFSARSPRNTRGSDTQFIKGLSREEGYRYFDCLVKEALEYEPIEFEEDPIDVLQCQSANKWRLDDIPIFIYAVDSQGEASAVSHMGGFVQIDQRNWQFIAEGIQFGINREFPE